MGFIYRPLLSPMPVILSLILCVFLFAGSKVYAETVSEELAENQGTVEDASVAVSTEVFKNTLLKEQARDSAKKTDFLNKTERVNARILSIAMPRIYSSAILFSEESESSKINATTETKGSLEDRRAGGLKIVSVPPVKLKQGVQFEYQLEVVSNQLQQIQVGLIDAPDGMFVTNTGFISWHPTRNQTGISLVKLRVEVEEGASQFQEFVIDVQP